MDTFKGVDHFKILKSTFNIISIKFLIIKYVKVKTKQKNIF